MALSSSHSRVIRYFSQRSPGALLDCPCGPGALSKQLHTLGWDVSCCDIDAGHFELHESLPFQAADLNEDPLPFEDESFDCILSANGLHRLYNPANAIDQFHRVLKPGGTLLLSWPNYGSLARRLVFLVTGSLGKSIDDPQCDQTISEPSANVRLPLSVARVHLLLRRSEFEVRQVFATGYRAYDLVSLPLAGLVKLMDFALGMNRRRASPLSNAWSTLRGGSTVFLDCKK